MYGQTVVQKERILAQDKLYEEAASGFGTALGRLARAYEADPDKRRDLIQEIHLALWRSFEKFDGRCSLRTWVYRVAHNAATTHVITQRRAKALSMVSLEEAEKLSDKNERKLASDERQTLDRLLALIQMLKPLDRQVIVSYLEGMDAASIGEITGISAGNVATKIHRIKNILARGFTKEDAMTNEVPPNDMRNVWQNQPMESTRMSVEELRHKAGKFQKRIQLRNLREYIAVLFVVVGFGFYLKWFPSVAMRVGSGLTIAAALYVAYQLHRIGSAETLPEDCGFECCIDFHRRELERQRDLLRRIWWWYLGPFVPGMLVFLVGLQVAREPRFPHHGIPFVVDLAFCALVFVLIGRLNQRTAHRLQRQIDDLHAMAKGQ
ncbi:MAG TPA: sigma-70 family RNA polymerase sigma factor [Bryobacteraceae bacterium]|nr:sigma-70 family RNA polymerase sigma factor [Bryobacteraceae bacterium]